MRVPIRKGGEFTNIIPDPNLTRKKFNEFSVKLKSLKLEQPKAILEVKRLAELGYFSENAAYQMAKGHLRSLNEKIFKLEEHLKAAVIIKPTGDRGVVQLGSRVTVELNDRQKTYLLLGSSEIDLKKNIISHNSPIGSVLMGKKAGENFQLELGDKKAQGLIVKVE